MTYAACTIVVHNPFTQYKPLCDVAQTTIFTCSQGTNFLCGSCFFLLWGCWMAYLDLLEPPGKQQIIPKWWIKLREIKKTLTLN